MKTVLIRAAAVAAPAFAAALLLGAPARPLAAMAPQASADTVKK